MYPELKRGNGEIMADCIAVKDVKGKAHLLLFLLSPYILVEYGIFNGRVYGFFFHNTNAM